MSFPFNSAIPQANDNPSVSQGQLLTNNGSINSILAVDHVSFNDAAGGKHQQVTLNTKNTPGAQTDPASTVYSGNGSASTVAELYFKNQQGAFLLSCIKAFGVFVGSNSPVTTLTNSYNVASISGSAGSYTITMTSGVIVGDNVVVFVTNSSAATVITWSFSGGVLTIAGANNNRVSFAILQA